MISLEMIPLIQSGLKVSGKWLDSIRAVNGVWLLLTPPRVHLLSGRGFELDKLTPGYEIDCTNYNFNVVFVLLPRGLSRTGCPRPLPQQGPLAASLVHPAPRLEPQLEAGAQLLESRVRGLVRPHVEPGVRPGGQRPPHLGPTEQRPLKGEAVPLLHEES